MWLYLRLCVLLKLVVSKGEDEKNCVFWLVENNWYYDSKNRFLVDFCFLGLNDWWFFGMYWWMKEENWNLINLRRFVLIRWGENKFLLICSYVLILNYLFVVNFFMWCLRNFFDGYFFYMFVKFCFFN